MTEAKIVQELGGRTDLLLTEIQVLTTVTTIHP